MTRLDSSSAQPPWRPRPGTDDALVALVGRVLGPNAPLVSVATGGDSAGRDYRVRSTAGQLTVTATDALSGATGFHHHLNAQIGRRVCWDTPLPVTLDHLAHGEVTGRATAEVGYYLNFCTFGYTAAFWDWDRWQREIDWMAMHGITMPLAAVGHEAVLAEVYRAAGLHDDQILAFLGGPSYLPWQFMGCLDSWGGPMDRRWLEARRELGARIIERQLEFGMTPVLPAFVGHVPTGLAGPGTTTRDWWGFVTHLLDPHDPQFRELARLTTVTQAHMLGTAHLYAADPFIEMMPPDDDPGYLSDVAAALIGGLRAGDPKAVWVMQAWTFDYLDWWTDARIARFLDAIDDDALLMLDLWGEHSPQWRRFGGFRGKPWIWCALHDFGGRGDAFGALERTAREADDAERAPEPPIGRGLAMEATEQNHVVYELVTDNVHPDDLETWIADFARQRYGVEHPNAAEAWTRLLGTVYAAPLERLVPSERPSVVTLRPDVDRLLDPASGERWLDASAWYSLDVLIDACRLLLELATERADLVEHELGHDLVVAVATAGCRTANAMLADVVNAWNRPGGHIDEPGHAFLRHLADLDALLDTRPELRLASWEAAATRTATDARQAMFLRRDARRLISEWNDAETGPLTDYSARLWSGVVAGLYRERWRVWFDALQQSRLTEPPTPADLDSRIGAVTSNFVTHGWPTVHDAAGDLPDRLDPVRRVLDTCARVLVRNPSAAPDTTTPRPSTSQESIP